MRIRLVHEFNYPMDFVLKVTHYDLLRNLEKFKEVLDLDEVKRSHFVEHSDGRIEVEFTVSAHKEIPRIAQAILKPEMLTWKQAGKWDPNTKKYHFEIIPFFMKKVFYGKGHWEYRQEGKKVIREVDAQISIKLPVVGKVIEQAIGREFYKSTERLYPRLRAQLEKEAAAEGIQPTS